MNIAQRRSDYLFRKLSVALPRLDRWARDYPSMLKPCKLIAVPLTSLKGQLVHTELCRASTRSWTLRIEPSSKKRTGAIHRGRPHFKWESAPVGFPSQNPLNFDEFKPQITWRASGHPKMKSNNMNPEARIILQMKRAESQRQDERPEGPTPRSRSGSEGPGV
jgi:hypothetical protein